MMLALWLVAGIIGFFAARASWGLTFGCAPIRVGTLLCMLVSMWLPPLTAAAAIIWATCWYFETYRPSKYPRPFKAKKPAVIGSALNRAIIKPIDRMLSYEVVNPCKWWGRK